MRALTMHGKTLAMPQSAIGADLHKPLDIQRNFLAQITFGFAIGKYNILNLCHFLFGKCPRTPCRIDVDSLEYMQGRKPTDTVYVGQGNTYLFLFWYVNARDSWHVLLLLLKSIFLYP